MKRQLVTSMGSLSIVIAAALLAPASAAEQPGAVPRLADGHPDLQGVWDYRTITPMQRPLELGTKEFFASDEERRTGNGAKTAGRIATRRTSKRAARLRKAVSPQGGPAGAGELPGEPPTTSSGGTAATRS
jgi:hypothetical protein